MRHLRSLYQKIVRSLLLALVAIHPSTFELGRLRYTLARRGRKLLILPSIAGGAPDEGEGDAGGGDGEEGDDDDGVRDGGEPAEDGEEGGRRERDWKREARRNERELKAARRQLADETKARKERENATKTEHERALEAARKESADAVRAEIETERKAERLETATLAAAARGIKIKVDGREQTVRFEDPDDAFLYLGKLLRSGDTSEDELFDSAGKVNKSALSEALSAILADKPKLAAGASGGGGGRGSNDAGRGSSPATSDLEDLSIDELYDQHVKGK